MTLLKKSSLFMSRAGRRQSFALEEIKTGYVVGAVTEALSAFGVAITIAIDDQSLDVKPSFETIRDGQGPHEEIRQFKRERVTGFIDFRILVAFDLCILEPDTVTACFRKLADLQKEHLL